MNLANLLFYACMMITSLSQGFFSLGALGQQNLETLTHRHPRVFTRRHLTF